MIRVENVEELKKMLEWACLVHRSQPKPKAKDSRISMLGVILPSHVWSNDADDVVEIDTTKYSVDDMWYIFENWFEGLSRKQKLIVLFRSGITGKKMPFKVIAWKLEDDYGFNQGVGRTTLYSEYEKAILKIFANAR